jgi:hypothetical protein
MTLCGVFMDDDYLEKFWYGELLDLKDFKV